MNDSMHYAIFHVITLALLFVTIFFSLVTFSPWFCFPFNTLLYHKIYRKPLFSFFKIFRDFVIVYKLKLAGCLRSLHGNAQFSLFFIRSIR